MRRPLAAGLLRRQPPTDWRTEVHYEFDFRDLYYSKPESALGVPMDKCSLAVVQDENFKYVHFAALPPLLFDLRKDPGQFVNRAADPAYAARLAEYSARMLDWRLGFADRTLTAIAPRPTAWKCARRRHDRDRADQASRDTQS